MSQNERRQALGRRDGDYEAAALRERVAQHEAHFLHLRPKVANLERDVEAILEILRKGAALDTIALQTKLTEIENAMRDLLA